LSPVNVRPLITLSVDGFGAGRKQIAHALEQTWLP
jgi:hypothetical protein